MGSILPVPASPEERGQPAAASAADSAVTVPGRKDLQHRRTEQGRRRHLPREGGGAVVTASLKDTAGTASPCCCDLRAKARILTAGTITYDRTPGWHRPPSFTDGKGKRLAQTRQQDESCRAWLRLPHAGRRARQPCPARQGLSLVYLLLPPSWAPQTLITSCHSISGPLCNPPPLPAVAALPDRSGRSLRPDSSQQDLAGSLPASCPVPAVPCLQLSPAS